MLQFKDLVNDFVELGLEKDDVILVYSSFASFGGVLGGPQIVIDALLDILGKNGTLIVPTFNFSFSNNKSIFDIKNTPSEMGIISEFVRKTNQSKRTIDPVYSFSILGKLKETLSSISYLNSYGKNSMFAKLREYNAKILMIGLSYTESMTFFHHVEEMQKVDYRYTKEFHGQFVNESGIISPCRISFRVRNLELGVKAEANRMGIILENEKISKIKKIGNSIVKLMNVNEVYDRTIKELKKNPHILYKINH
jgi:aminoglycoside 3-N-acetyltransferase